MNSTHLSLLGSSLKSSIFLLYFLNWLSHYHTSIIISHEKITNLFLFKIFFLCIYIVYDTVLHKYIIIQVYIIHCCTLSIFSFPFLSLSLSLSLLHLLHLLLDGFAFILMSYIHIWFTFLYKTHELHIVDWLTSLNMVILSCIHFLANDITFFIMGEKNWRHLCHICITKSSAIAIYVCS